MGARKRNVVAVIKMVPKFMGAYFLRILIILTICIYEYIINGKCMNQHKKINAMIIHNQNLLVQYIHFHTNFSVMNLGLLC